MAEFIEFLIEDKLTGESTSKRVMIEDPNDSVLLLGKLNKVSIPTSCGGSGTCGTCRVFIIEGQDCLPAPNAVEQEFILERKFESNERLACQINPVPGLKIKVVPN